MNQSELSSDVRDFILRVENRFNHQYTVVCGDFNMNPFDEGLIKAKGFHAIMNKKIALKGKRKINDKDYSFFYNPMWGFLGNGVVSGTMYYNSSDHINYFWHMYNPQIQISAESETKRSIFREKDKTKRSKKESAQHSKSRNKSFVMTSVSAL